MIDLTYMDYTIEYKNKESYWECILEPWPGVLWTLLQTYALKVPICLQFIWLKRDSNITSIDSKQTSNHS